jgi:hypothetical protein
MSATCPLCGLRYAGQSLLDLHIREDHAQRERGREPPAARRALSRLTRAGRGTADRAGKAD